MRKILLVIAIVFLGLSYATQSQAAKLCFQTRAHGKDCEKDRGLCIFIEISVAGLNAIPNPAWQADGSVQGSVLTLQTENILKPWGGDDFIVDQDVKVSDIVARSLGLNSMTIKAGTYKIDFSKNKLGTVRLNIVTM